jgi:hypothetical protein
MQHPSPAHICAQQPPFPHIWEQQPPFPHICIMVPQHPSLPQLPKIAVHVVPQQANRPVAPPLQEPEHDAVKHPFSPKHAAQQPPNMPPSPHEVAQQLDLDAFFFFFFFRDCAGSGSS